MENEMSDIHSKDMDSKSILNIVYTIRYFLFHPGEYLRYFHTGDVVRNTYIWKRRIEKGRKR